MRTEVQVRWLIRRDMPQVMAIEQQAERGDWTEEEIVSEMTGRRTIGMVAEKGDRILGYMIYELLRDGLQIIKLVVDNDHRREGIGTQMFEKLRDKLAQQKRVRLEVFVHECDIGSQLFCKAMGFRAVRVTNPMEDGRSDYEFVYTRPTRSQKSIELEGRLVECD